MALGLRKVLLPLGTSDARSPHVPIFVSSSSGNSDSSGDDNDNDDKDTSPGPSRAVLVFGETAQDLGVVAHRVVSGPGGVDRGSMTSVVAALLRQRSSPTDARPPAVVLANPGQLLWWQPRSGPDLDLDRGGGNGGDANGEGAGTGAGAAAEATGRAMTRHAFDAAPMRSAVHDGVLVDEARNRVPGNRDADEHVRYVFEQVVPSLVLGDARLDVVAVGDAADAVERYLDRDAAWSRWGGRVACFANLGGYHPAWELKCDGFKQFLRDVSLTRLHACCSTSF